MLLVAGTFLLVVGIGFHHIAQDPQPLPGPVPAGSAAARGALGSVVGRLAEDGTATGGAQTGAQTGAGSAIPAGVPGDTDLFEHTPLYVDPDGAAARAERQLRGTDAAQAAVLARIADRSHADWFGDPDPAAVRREVSARVDEVHAAGALPVLVAYGIPHRDCGGGHSTGGVADPAAYQAWITAFAAGIGSRSAAVVLEPDALSQLDCLSPAEASARYALLNFAVDRLAATGAEVYLDAGNASWHPVADMAARLRQAGVDRTRGFALNVSNFDGTAREVAYGNAIVAQLGGALHYVVDTSRNGRGPAADNAWCNPAGRGLGQAPTAQTGDPRADAFLWIKIPGESDGTCNGGPPAGQWWLDYALGLATQAA